MKSQCEGGCPDCEGNKSCETTDPTLKHAEGFRDKLYTIDQTGHRKWVYADIIVGRLTKIRRVVAYTLLVLYLGMPWIKIDGRQAVLIDIRNRSLTLFGAQFWATDTLFLMLLLGSAAITLFFVTSLFGRLWCGWACPETIFLEFVFRPIERLIEGSPTKRKKLDEGPWTLSKVQKKVLRHSISAILSWFIATTFLAYFYGSDQMVNMVSSAPWQHTYQFTLTLIFMGVFAFQFGWFREQFCTVLCPYARFQSVMLDANSLVIGYDRRRGEPRGKKRSKTEQSGSCVDCGACVRVCPTGIDIRNGLQLECVNCAACIDACNSIMDGIGEPHGLIRYDTERALNGEKSRILRPRVFVYAAILLLYGCLFGYHLLNRTAVDFEVLRAVGTLPYSELPDGRLSNQLRVRVSNKSFRDGVYQISLGEQVPGVEFVTPVNPVTVSGGEIKTEPVFLTFPKELIQKGKQDITVVLTGEHAQRTQKVRLIGPDK